MNIMKFFTVLVFVYALSGCRRGPRRDLSNIEGVTAAYFNVEKERVNKLSEREFSHTEIIKILMITQATHMQEKDVLERLEDGESLDNIAEDAGYEVEEFNRQVESIEENISSY